MEANALPPPDTAETPVANLATSRRVSTSSTGSYHPDPLISLSPKDPPRRSVTSDDFDDSDFDDEFDDPHPRIENNDYFQYNRLFKAVEKGDWVATKRFLDDRPQALTAKITDDGRTALHVAAAAGHVHVVEGLVQFMSESDLEIQDNHGGTALFAAAASGITQIAAFMVRKNRGLLTIACSKDLIPVVVAANRNHFDMVRYLYHVTPLESLVAENEKRGATIVVNCINAQEFDIALDMLGRYPRLAFALDKSGFTPILALAQMPYAFPGGKQLKFWQRWLYSCIKVQPLKTSCDNSTSCQEAVECWGDEGKIVDSGQRLSFSLGSSFLKLLGLMKMYEVKVKCLQAQDLLDRMCKEIPALNIRQLSQGKVYVYGAILQAVIHGNADFLVSLIKANPSLLWTLGPSKRGIFMYAVKYRQEKIWSLIYGLVARKQIVGMRDCMCNNLLHVAGMLPHATRSDQVRGAALQMQREMQWFKEVENVVHPKFLKERCMLRTPHQVFTQNHKDLKKNGEEWMKDIARPCVIVSAIIFVIMFAAAFIIPGSNLPDPAGYPLFLQDKHFNVFAVSYGLSLFASMTSMLTFLAILTSRFAEEDFLKDLPAKMILGLSTLSLSVGAVGVAFGVALGRLLDGRMPIWLLLSLMASLPITVFMLFLSPVLFEMFISTFGPSIFCRNMKRWL